MDSFKDRLLRRLDQVDDLPTLPASVAALNRTLADPNAGADNIAEVLATDPSLTSKLLRVANSPYYGAAAGQITSVPQAVVRVGFRELGKLFTSVAVIDTFENVGRNLDHVSFWKHCLTTAIATRLICRYGTIPDTIDENDAYVAGLLHDIGAIVLDQYFPQVVRQVRRVADEREYPYAIVEKRILKIDHGEIGGFLLEKWNLQQRVACRRSPSTWAALRI